MTESKKPHILVVGMARSGTTLVTNLVASSSEFSVEVEPHALWKTGNFKYLSDEEYDVTDSIVASIQHSFVKASKGRRILEKSPINSLRPQLVHSVFPEAKIVYVERDPIRCIHSNYIRSLKNDSFKPAITLKKYFLKAGTDDLPYAISGRSLFSQISISDIPSFISYVGWMVFMRNMYTGLFPFGPKLKGFLEFVKSKGLLAYHVSVYKQSLERKEDFKKLYGTRLQVFKLEDLMNNMEELKRLFKWVEVEMSDDDIKLVFNNINEDRKGNAIKNNSIDPEIISLLDQK